MQITYRLKASELNQKIMDGIKAVYGDREIDIIIREVDQTDSLWQSEANRRKLEQAIDEINEGKNLIQVSLEELQ